MTWDDEYANFVFSRLNPEMDNFGIAGGLCGEAGEVIELFKKDKYHGVPLDPQKALKELGDALFYLTGLGNRLGYTLFDIAEANQKKLEARYPNGFVKGGGIRHEDGCMLSTEQCRNHVNEHGGFCKPHGFSVVKLPSREGV